MLNFDEQRFLRIQSGAVSLAGDIHEPSAGSSHRGRANLFFLGSGGAGILMHPAARLLQTRSTFPCSSRCPRRSSSRDRSTSVTGSVVVIPSLSGTTKESVEALEYCRARGATIITLTGHADTPLAQDADHSFVELRGGRHLVRVLLSAVAAAGAVGDAPPRRVRRLRRRPSASCETLPDLLAGGQAGLRAPRGRAGRGLKDEPYHIITGAGSTWPRGLLLRDVHPGGDAVDPDPSGARLRLLPRHARAGRAGRQRPAAQGRGRHPAAGRAGGEVRAPLHRQGAGARRGRPRACRGSRTTSARCFRRCCSRRSWSASVPIWRCCATIR